MPGTHYREIMPGLLLLGSTGATHFYDWLGNRRLRIAALAAFGLFLAASLHYVFVAWIQPYPEYQLLYPTLRHPLDWRTDDDQRNAGGTFGAARRHGWKTVAELVAQGQLPREYTTNERPSEAAWYMKSSWICDQAARMYVRSPRFLRDRQAIERAEPLNGYSLAGQVTTGGHPTLAIYTRQPLAGGPYIWRSEDYGDSYDRFLVALDPSRPPVPPGLEQRAGLPVLTLSGGAKRGWLYGRLTRQGA